MENLRTERLTLVALKPELARAALEDRGKLARMLGARVPEAWPGADFATISEREFCGGDPTLRAAQVMSF